MRLLKSKKRAMAMSVLIILIISIFAGIVLMYFSVKLVKEMKRKVDKDVCLFSIKTNSKVKEISWGAVEDVQIQCPVIKYEAKDTNEKITDISSILEQLDHCWYKMGEGKIPVFGTGFITKQSNCIVCSKFTTNNKIFASALEDKLITRKSKYSKTKTISEFLMFGDQQAFDLDFSIYNEDGHRTNVISKSTKDEKNNYIVVFRRFGREVIGKKLFRTDESQKIFITNEQGLVNIKSEGKQGFNCNQILWQEE